MTRFATAFAFVLAAALVVCHATAEELERPPPIVGAKPDVPAGEQAPEGLPDETKDWTLDPDSGYYWSPSEQLFYDEASGHFYDPTSEHWYDPATQEWYKHEAAAGAEGDGETEESATGVDADDGTAAEAGAESLFDLPVEHGDWVHEAHRGLYWSEGAQLYFSRTTGRFFDPKTKAWYDAEKDAWTAEEPEA
jgi:hypothetical protein